MIEDYGKLPPQAIDIEEAVLGALLLEQDAYQLVSAILKPEYFYKEAHQLVYQAIESLNNAGKVVDILTVSQELKRLDKLEDVGGAYSVSLLPQNVASSAHIEHHALVIVDKYQRRNLIKKSAVLSALAYDESVDLEDVISSISGIEEEAIRTSVMSDMKDLKSVNDKALEEIRHTVEKRKRGEPVCIDTPVDALNSIIGGFSNVEYVIIAARPGESKTGFSLACAKHQAENGFKPAFFSLEMPGTALSKRLFCVDAGVDSIQLKTGNLSPYDLSKIEESKKHLDELGIYISDEFTNTVARVKASAKKLKSKGLLDIIYLDYLQLMEGEGSNRQEQVSKISRSIKMMAKELEVPVVAMSQLSRATEQQARNPRPKLSHLRESGSIEQDSDTIIFLFWPAKYDLLNEDDQPYSPYDVELIVAKHRVGATGTAHASTNRTKSVYYDRTYQQKQEPDKLFTDGESNPFSDFQEEYNRGSLGQGELFDE